jgi:hypothetical protein
MKKIWWPVGACLLIIIFILVIMHAFRHDRTPETAVYQTQGAPAMNGGSSPYEKPVDQSYPIVRPGPSPQGEYYGDQAPSPGPRPRDKGITHYGNNAPGPQPQEEMYPDSQPQPDPLPDGQADSPDLMEQPPDQDQYEDGNPEEMPPPDGQYDE